MSASTVAAVGALVDSHRELMPTLAESMHDNDGKVLPHLVMADIVRWLASHVESDLHTCRSVLDWMEEAYARGPEDVQGLIIVSGIEMIPDPGQPGAELRDLLGPTLRKLDQWV